MNVLLLSTHDCEGGAGKAAWRLMTGLRAAGTDARMLAQVRASGSDLVEERSSWIARRLSPLMPLVDSLPAEVLYRGRPNTHWATGWFPRRVAAEVRRRRPDVVHLHWICRGFVPVPAIARFGAAPVVWTLHDSWAFTGGCHVPGNCERFQQKCGCCPQLESRREHDLSRWIWSRKRRRWSGVPLTIVTPSRWLGERARSSALFRNARIEVIPNGIDTEMFKPAGREQAREALDLPRDRRIVLFTAMNANTDRNKGFHLLQPALRRLAAAHPEPIEAVVVGDVAPARPPDVGMPLRYLGVLRDDASLVQAYSAADVFVLPSLQENLPNTIIEAMACGTPAVAFRTSGIPELIDHERSGYLAQPFDANDLARGLGLAMGEGSRRMGEAARAAVQAKFAIAAMVRRHQELYAGLTTAGRP